MTAPLTPKQKECLDYVKDHWARLGCSPTYREIMAALDYKSVAGIMGLIISLEQAGYVRRSGRHKPRGLEVLDQNKCPHCGNALGSSLCREAANRNITYSSTPISAGAPA